MLFMIHNWSGNDIWIYFKMMFIILIFGLTLSPLSFADSNESPLLQELLVPRNLAENRTVKLSCAPIQGESVDFHWYLDDRELDSNSRRKIVSHNELSELVIKSLSVDDLGEIKCIGRNKFGQDIQRVSLVFNGR